MTSADLKPARVEALFAAVDRHRRLPKLPYARCVVAALPADDPLLLETRRSLLDCRALAPAANDGRAEGVQRLYVTRAAWPAV